MVVNPRLRSTFVSTALGKRVGRINKISVPKHLNCNGKNFQQHAKYIFIKQLNTFFLREQLKIRENV